jgi:hypothetical protein
MSASDLAQFARMHMNGGRNQTGVRVVSAASVRAMQRRQIRAPRHTPHGISHWGLGWMLIDWNGHRLYGHDGATIGQQAFLRILPEQNLAVAMLTNGGDMTGLFHEMYGEIFRRLAGLAPAAVPEYDPFRTAAGSVLSIATPPGSVPGIRCWTVTCFCFQTSMAAGPSTSRWGCGSIDELTAERRRPQTCTRFARFR